MMEEHKKNSTVKYFDIAPPGKVAPDPSSKPILVSNKPEQSDPMVSSPQQLATSSPPEEVADTSPAPEEPVAVVPAVEPPQVTPEPAQPTAPSEDKVFDHYKPKSSWLERILLLIFVLVIIFVIIDLLIDAGVINTTIKPLTHFFHT